MKFWRAFCIFFIVLHDGSSLEIIRKDDIVLSANPVSVTFTSPDTILRFPPWNFQKYPIMEIEFHTREPKGILFYVDSSSSNQDCLGIEIFNSNIYAFGKLIGKDFKIQLNPPDVSVSTGKFHKVSIQLDLTNYFTMTFDGTPAPRRINSPGKLDFESYSYLGGIDSPTRLPWNSYSQQGFAGCINYVRVNNEQFVDIKEHSKQGEITGIQTGVCKTSVARCTPGICGSGKCYERSYNLLDQTKNFYCDCSGTTKSYSTFALDILRGEPCRLDASKFECNSKSYIFYAFEREKSTHLDDISLDFKTTNSREPLFLMKKGTTEALTTYISSELISGQVLLVLKLFESNNPSYKTTLFSTKNNLNDGQWHTLKIKRYAENVEMFVDEKNFITKETLHRSVNLEKFFNKVKEIYLGSVTKPPDKNKCTGELRHFYWNEDDLLGKRNVYGKYNSQIVTDKPKLPVLPPFPRQPPIPCSVKPGHSYTILNDVPLGNDGMIIMMEFKTKYDGIIWHATSTTWNEVWITVMISSNSLVFIHNLFSNNGIQIVDVTRGGISIKDNTWHRIVAQFNKDKEQLFIHIDDVESLTSEIQLPTSRDIFSNINFISFHLGGIQSGIQRQEMLRLLKDKTPDVSKLFTNEYDTSFVGCFGEVLTNKDNFTMNLIQKPNVMTNPRNSLVCRACEDDFMKCPKGYCQNNGKCYNVNSKAIACNCSGTNFYGQFCDIKKPTCDPNPCRHGNCQIVLNNRICNCTGTGYTGFECEISRCSNYKCLNNGVCIIKKGQPECDCSMTKYEGTYCEIPRCPTDFCKNNGQCRLHGESQLPFCICNNTGYTGFSCDKPICSPNHCNNNGKCVVRDDKPYCYCYDGRIGEKCEKSLCPPDQCLNGGTCVAKKNKALCICPSDLKGDRCERCPPDFCFNGGRCEIKNSVPSCNCSDISFGGSKCESPTKCPSNYCENNGQCLVAGNGFLCNCSGIGYSGERCTNKIGCPDGYCKNGGLCQINNGRFSCDCSLTPYIGEFCDQKANGILCDYHNPGYAITPFKPLMVSNGTITSMGFQTFVKSGTLFCYETVDEKYWLIKLVEGKLTVDINGNLFAMQKVVNDGNYHVLRVARDRENFMITLDNPISETLIIPTLITSILTLPNNVIVYTRLTLCNSCPETKNKDRFQGTIGNVKSGDIHISNGIKNNQAAMIGGIQNQLTPLIPLPPVPSIVFCYPGFCKNGGNCSVRNYGPACNCGQSGFTGNQCEMNIYVIKSIPPTPGYVVLNVNPVLPSNFDLMRFMFQLYDSNSPLISFITSDSNYVEIKVENDLMVVKENGVYKGSFKNKLLERNVTHFLKVVNLLGRVTLYVNGTRLGHVTLNKPTIMSNGSLKISQLLIGANKNLDETIKGSLGDFQHNNFLLFGPNGSIAAPAVSVPTVKIETWKKIGRQMPEIKKQFKGSHGGAVFKSLEFVVAEGFGAGLIIEISGGPTILGAQMLNPYAIGVNPLALGIIIGIILLIIAIIWAIFNLICGRGRVAEAAAISGGAAFGNMSFMKSEPLIQANSSYLQASAAADYNIFNQSFMTFGHRNTGTGRSIKGGEADLTISSAKYQRLDQNKVDSNFLLSSGQYIQSSQPIDIAAERVELLKDANNYEEDAQMRQPNVFTDEEMKLDCCVLTHNSKSAITGSMNGPPQIWDLISGSLVHIMDGSNQACTSLQLALNDSILIGLVTQNQQPMSLKMMMLWSFPEGQIMDFENEFICTTCYVSHDGNYLIIADDPKESSITILNLSNMQILREDYRKSENMTADGIQFLRVSKNFSFMLAGYQTVDNMSYYMVFSINKNRIEELNTFKARSNLSCCEFINNTEAVTGIESGELLIWNVQTAQITKKIFMTAVTSVGVEVTLNAHDKAVQCLAVSSDGSVLVSGSTDSKVRVWNLNSRKIIYSFNKHTDEVRSLALSDDCEILVSGSLDGSIRIWNISTGLEMCCFASNIQINKVLLSFDKNVIVGLGERGAVNKLVMMKLLRNIQQITRNANVNNQGIFDEYISPPL